MYNQVYGTYGAQVPNNYPPSIKTSCPQDVEIVAEVSKDPPS